MSATMAVLSSSLEVILLLGEFKFLSIPVKILSTSSDERSFGLTSWLMYPSVIIELNLKYSFSCEQLVTNISIISGHSFLGISILQIPCLNSVYYLQLPMQLLYEFLSLEKPKLKERNF